MLHCAPPDQGCTHALGNCSGLGLGLSPAITPNQGRGGIQYPTFIILWSKQNGWDLSLSCWAGAPVGRVHRWLGLALAPRHEMGMKGAHPELTQIPLLVGRFPLPMLVQAGG